MVQLTQDAVHWMRRDVTYNLPQVRFTADIILPAQIPMKIAATSTTAAKSLLFSRNSMEAKTFAALWMYTVCPHLIISFYHFIFLSRVLR